MKYFRVGVGTPFLVGIQIYNYMMMMKLVMAMKQMTRKSPSNKKSESF